MATRAQVERAIAAQPERSGVDVFEPGGDGRLRKLASRPPAEGGGSVIVVLGDGLSGTSPLHLVEGDG